MILKFYLSLLILFINFLSWGYFASKILKIDIRDCVGKIGFLGFFFISFVITFSHFFIKISDYFILFIVIIGILYFIKQWKFFFQIFSSKRLSTIFFFLLSIIFFSFHHPNEDFGFYHLPYIVNFKSEKIILGLSNLQIHQGWNSMWLNLHSFTAFELDQYVSAYLLNILFYIFFNIFLMSQILEKKQFYQFKNYDENLILYKSFCLFIFCFFNIKFARLNSYGIDVPANFLVLFSIIILFQIIFFQLKTKDNFKFFIILIIFAFFIRISNAFFLLLPIYFAIRFKLVNYFIKTRVFVLSFLFFVFFLIQQFLYTGCFIFPYKIFCFVEPIWYNKNFITEFQLATFLANKNFNYYNGDLTFEQYHSLFNWVPTWFTRSKVEISEYLMTFLIPSLFLISYKKFPKKNEINKILFNKDFLFIYFICFVSLFLWFANSPMIRMGYHFVIPIIFCFIILILNFFGQLDLDTLYYRSKIILCLAISFFIIKNVNRVLKIDDKTNLYPKFPVINFQTENKNNINLNKVIEGDTIQSRVCWNTPFMCAITDLNNIKILNINNYLVITKN